MRRLPVFLKYTGTYLSWMLLTQSPWQDDRLHVSNSRVSSGFSNSSAKMFGVLTNKGHGTPENYSCEDCRYVRQGCTAAPQDIEQAPETCF